MTTNQTISFPRELSDELGELIAEKARVCGGGAFDIWEAICEQFGTSDLRPRGNPEGKREYFEKWVMATKHPVFGFLDGRSLARSDDRTGYADEYVQGLWVAYLEFGAAQFQGEPVARHPDAIIEGVMTSVGITHAIYASTVSLKHGEQVKLYAEQPAPVALRFTRAFTVEDFASDLCEADGAVGKIEPQFYIPACEALIAKGYVKMCDCNQGRFPCNGKCKPTS